MKAEYELSMIYARTKQNDLAEKTLAGWKTLGVLDREVRRELANLEPAREARWSHSARQEGASGDKSAGREYPR